MVCCDGIYADVYDYSLKQKVVRGRYIVLGCLEQFIKYILGFQTMTHELGQGNTRLYTVLQQMFPPQHASADEEIDDLMASTKGRVAEKKFFFRTWSD